MSKLVIIRGNSGSGKTTIAKGLQKKFGRNTLLISQDVIRREMLWVLDGKENMALPLLNTMLQYGHEHCPYVILEGILNATWYRKLFESAKSLFDSEIYAYYYELPFEETLKRHETKPNRQEFGEQEMKQWWNEKDYIGIIPESKITLEWSAQDTIQRIYTEVMGE